MKDFKEHFWMLQKKLKTGEPFAFCRYSDGEMIVMQNKQLILSADETTVDGKKAGATYDKADHKEFDPKRHKKFHTDLIRAYQHHQDNYFVGLSCPCCVGKENNEWMKELRGGDDDHLTWSNLLVNSNYPLFLQHMLPLLKDKKVVIVCNEAADLSDLPFEVMEDFRIGSNAMINDIDLIWQMDEYIEDLEYDNCVFLFAAASLSNLLIHKLYSSHSQHTYIDIGTTLNPHMKLPVARNYLKGYWNNSGNTEIHKVCVW
ncbi:MAG TPA: hypothetical protein VMW36_01550 [Patescibacteria group bacterium]|nr:hypothetical protein [Patescibacteria group bacterium]